MPLMRVPEGHSTSLRSDLSCHAVAAATRSLWKLQLLLRSGALSSCPAVAATDPLVDRVGSLLLLPPLPPLLPLTLTTTDAAAAH